VFLPGGSGNTTRQNTQIAHNTQNNTTINETHNKEHTTQTEYKLLQLQLYKLILIKYKHAIH
jgi:hypothetical protein